MPQILFNAGKLINQNTYLPPNRPPPQNFVDKSWYLRVVKIRAPITETLISTFCFIQLTFLLIAGAIYRPVGILRGFWKIGAEKGTSVLVYPEWSALGRVRSRTVSRGKQNRTG